MTEKQAKKWGKWLRNKMKGTGWECRIWQNSGWHYAAYNKTLTIHPFCHYCGDMPPNRFFALLSCDNSGGGEQYWTDNKYFSKDPNKAASHQIKLARRHIQRANKVVSELEDRISGI